MFPVCTSLPSNMRMQSDAASRPQDRVDFDIWKQRKGFPDLSLAARLMGNPLGGVCIQSD
jgi:hypothetical protein